MLDWFSRNSRDLPWRQTRDPYAIWISEIMLQQTQVKTVMPFWERWMKNLPNIRAVASAKPEKVLKLWEGLGYYSRARNLQKAAQEICDKHDGRFPRDFDAILDLPGIGRYTAGAIASIAFNDPRPILDGNVVRVLTRVFGIESNPREKATNAQLWKIADELVNRAATVRIDYGIRHTRFSNTVSHFNQSMMELGALVCTPRQPKCPVCPLKKTCVAFRQNLIESIPNLAKRAEPTRRKFIAFLVKKDGCYLVQQRPGKGVNARLWEFPNFEVNEGNKVRNPHPIPDGIPFCTIKHSITRYRITLDVFRVVPDSWKNPRGQWLRLGNLHRLAFSSAHRQIVSLLTNAEGRTAIKLTSPSGNGVE
ncbi:MAG: A/G-specific adenine glycosylase [Verrucomicrobiota bacterium]